MENASKALIMAAGILMAVLTITTIGILVSIFSEYGNKYEENISLQKINEFNADFLKYERNDLRIQDVMTLANLVKEWNSTGLKNEKITLIITGITGVTDQDYIKYDNMQDDNDKITQTNLQYTTYTMRVEEYYSSGRIKKIIVRKKL